MHYNEWNLTISEYIKVQHDLKKLGNPTLKQTALDTVLQGKHKFHGCENVMKHQIGKIQMQSVHTYTELHDVENFKVNKWKCDEFVSTASFRLFSVYHLKNQILSSEMGIISKR